jgi:tRNA nucleotidyltransferase (CCA-adding enzyme)
MPALTINSIDPSLRPIAQKLLRAFAAARGRAYVVGGAVRDALMGNLAKDLDIEVYGLAAEGIEKAIASVAPFDAVGKSFGVYKLKSLPIDIALPRRESKTGDGHKAFEVIGDPGMSFEEACARRDFTINAILWDPSAEGGKLIDPFNGQGDLQKKILRHTSGHFAEDPLRVLRAMQFAARFEFSVDPATVALCAKIQPEGLPSERLFEEWKKLILKGKKPSIGLNFLRGCGWIKYYPELEAMIGCKQEPEWHPEGDVWVHTLHCLDAFAEERIGDDWENLIVGLAVLLHDAGKPATTQFIDGRWRSRGHDTAGVPVARSFLRRLTSEAAIFDEVLPLVETHMRPLEFYSTKAGDAAIRRLAGKVKRIDRLVRLDKADMHGRPPMSFDSPQGEWLLEQARRLEVEAQAPKPILQGRNLIELGYAPSPEFKKILNACYEAQLDGKFKDLPGGLEFLKNYLKETQIKK